MDEVLSAPLPMVRDRRIFTPRTGMPEYVPVVAMDCIGRPIEMADCNKSSLRLFPQDQITVAEMRSDGRTLLCRHSAASTLGLLILDLHDTQPAKL